MQKVVFSLVLPAYNEEGRLESAVKAATSSLSGTAYEIIIAEDGCSDGTPAIASRLARKYARVRHLHSDAKLGRGRALCNAFANARGSLVAYMDVDLATSPKHLKKLMAQLKRNDVVTGSRYASGSKARRSAARLALSRAYNLLVNALLGSNLSDHQCGFKGFKRKAAGELCAMAKNNHWFWDTEVLVLAQRNGMKVAEIPVEWNEDAEGKTKIDFKRDVLGMGLALVKMRLGEY